MRVIFIAKNEFIIEKKVYNGCDDGGQYKGASGKSEFVGEGDLECFKNMECEFIKRSEEAEELG